MYPVELDGYKPGSKINLLGYTSTTRDKRIALNFATKDLGEGEKIPVVLQI